MTNKEKARAIQEAEAKFYAWTPATTDQTTHFRCHHIYTKPLVMEEICKNRARNALYDNICTGCPRYKYYKKPPRTPAAPAR